MEYNKIRLIAMRKQFTNLLKIAITLLGLILVLTQFDLQIIGQTLQQADLFWLLVGFVLVNASVILRAYRWLLLIRGLHTQISFGRLVELYYVGSFFNVFLPSGFGGDIVRVLEVSRDISADIATGTVIIDRLSGLMMLFALALLALPFRPPDFPQQLLWFIIITSVAGLIAGFVLLDGRVLYYLSQLIPSQIINVGGGFLLKVAQAVDECGWPAIARAMLVSLLFNLLQAIWWTTTAYALDLTIPFTYMLLVVPILSLALLIPSIGGLGVREFLAPLLFIGAGISPEEAIALTFLVFLLERVSGLLGGPVYIYATIRDRKKNRERGADR